MISVLYYQFEYSFTTQDSILDAHENYYYSEMVYGWGNPPDTNLVINEINNLKMWCGIYNRDTTLLGIPVAGKIYWSNLPDGILIDNFYTWTFSSDYEQEYNIKIPLDVSFGVINERPATVIDNGSYLFYMIIDYIPPSEINNLVFAFILSLIFIVGLYFFISRYLKPVQLMKDRIRDLELGDLNSNIDIIGEDELAQLSISMNKLIKEINILLENKHQLLLEVSHELRSPLARMQLLVAMLPEHKNTNRLIEEINFLEGMINNLLLSDRLSLPYSKLDLKAFTTTQIINKVLDMFPKKKDIINVNNHIPNETVYIDETKFTLAMRNLIDNAIKYSDPEKEIAVNIFKNKTLEFQVIDQGIGINNKTLEKVTEPFYQADQTVTTKGFGLGLTICKKIIESHGGFLTIDSEEGKGSNFCLHLKLKKEL